MLSENSLWIIMNPIYTHARFVSPQEAVIKYCAHLHHTLAALKRYFPASLVAPLSNSEQINHPSSIHTYTKSTPKHIHHHYAPSVTLAYTPHIITPVFVDRPHRSKLHCCPDGRRSWLVDYKREHRTLPLAMVKGVGKQQPVILMNILKCGK